MLAPLIWLWQASLLPDSYSVMDMGYADWGGGPVLDAGVGTRRNSAGHAGHTAMVHAVNAAQSITSLAAAPARPPDVSVTLVARRQRFRLASGQGVDGYTLNGSSPGPVIRAAAGQLLQVRLVNQSVPDGVTLHWHGVDVPNAEDGVAGVTQDAVRPGKEFTYRFVPRQAGTFWYHSHQVSHVQVRRGLLGALVVTPADPPQDEVDVVALTHLYAGRHTVNGREGETRVAVPPGARARVRVINTDNGQVPVWVAGSPYRLVAVDGTDVSGPAPVRDRYVAVTAGGRADLEVTMPASGAPVRVQIAGSASVVLGSGALAAPVAAPPPGAVDLLTYGVAAPLGFDPDRADRAFHYDVGRRPGFLDGRPGVWWTINGHMFPNVPMFVVGAGDVVRMRISNHSGEAHPMHLHGHHAVVLARDGVRATGSPWWVDSLNVGNGESYEIAFVADNPGVWMDHCHNLPHAAEGLVAHLMYAGVTTPFRVGDGAGNQPE